MKQRIDVIDKVLNACYQHNPDALFIMSLMHQYEERGSLSRKQLEGLFLKAQKVKDMPPNWLATLEATILKMPVREKAAATPANTKQEEPSKEAQLIDQLLAKYPQHKAVLLLQQKLQKYQSLTPPDQTELERLARLLLKA
jgi:hypothetical protein